MDSSRHAGTAAVGRDTELALFIKIAHPAVTVILTEADGPGTLILDQEHGAFGDSELEVLCELIRRRQRRSIVRIADPHRLLVSRALDRGADGVMIPRAESTASVEEALRGARTAPTGLRGWDPTTAALGFGTRMAAAQPARFLVQIETAGALRDAEAIARLDGVTDLFVGPADLSLALTGTTRLFAPEVIDAVQALPGRVRGAGVRLGLYVDTPDRAAWAVELGYRFLAVGSDVGLLASGAARVALDSFAALRTTR